METEEAVNLSCCPHAGLDLTLPLSKQKSVRQCRQLEPRVKDLGRCPFLGELFFSGTAVLYVLLIYLYLTPALSPPLLATEPLAKEKRGR